jgi:hypothetical protein
MRVPDRSDLPPLRDYAAVCLTDGSARTVGYTEASRGCKHLCRHCPVVPVYGGHFRVVPVDIVMADIRQQVDAGARHVTFGDPDFFNGIGHARRVIETFAREFPALSYDVTVKVEHLLEHAEMLPQLRRTGCLFVTSAAESLDDAVLKRLNKGHSRADFEEVVRLCHAADLVLAPTFIPFTPWTTVADYVQLLDRLDDLDLVNHVPAVQLTLRLLIAAGSPLLSLDDVRALAEPFDDEALVYPWRHPDPEVDLLQRRAARLVRERAGAPRSDLFEALRDLAVGVAPRGIPVERAGEPVRRRTEVPYLDEPWYC